MLQKLMDYDPAKGAEYATYIFPFIRDAMLRFRMACGRVSSWKDRPTFEELAVKFEGSTASGAERAYRRAVDKLAELLVAEGALHAVWLKQVSRTKRKKKIVAAIYEYQADCDGELGELRTAQQK